MRSILLAFVICHGLFAAAIPPLICASGGAVGTVDLRVTSPSRKADQALPLRTITRLEEGDIVQYRPILRPHQERKGDVTMVLVPANKKAAGKEKFLIFDPKPAGREQQWKVPWRTALVAFVYGPSGLSVRKVQSLLNKDDELIGELADYADKTAKTEALIAALTSSDNSQETVSAALHGFSAQYGTAELARTAPLDQQTMTMIQTLNPSVATYDPLAGQGSQPVGQTAGLASAVAQMFFGSPIGLAAGGTAMVLNLEALAFPRTEFRSVFSQAMPEDALGLCGKTGAAQVHTRIAYLWAVRVPNTVAPKLSVGKANSLPADVKSPLPLTGPKADWKYLDHARNWMLTPDKGKAIPVKVQVLANADSIELELDKNVKPGHYKLSANWDWDEFQVGGSLDVRPLADFAKTKLTAASQARLIADSGKLPLTLQGADFEFVTKVQMKKLNDEFASESAVPFVLPKGLREAVQDKMDIQVDTSGLDAGKYQLTLSQVDGKAHEVPLLILRPLPVIDNLPFDVHQGVSTVSFNLKGKRLDLLQRIDLTHGTASLGAASADGSGRPVTLKLAPGLAAGATLELRAFVVNRTDPVTFPDAVDVVAPRPVIANVTMSPVPMQTLQLNSGELPSGLTLSAMMRVKNLPAGSSVRLACEQTSTGAVTLQPGVVGKDARLKQLTADELYVTFNTGAWINGCKLQASVIGASGDSDPDSIGTVVDIPSIEEFDLGADPAGQQIGATLIGRNLETIEKAGWAPDQATPVSELPQPLSNDGLQQKLELHLPAPPVPDAVLYIWLRGESKPRLTTVSAN